jgi:putative aminopeptidase FrvX
MHPIDENARAVHLAWLLDLTAVPTAAGHEDRVIRWIERWVAERPDLNLTRDPSGNLTVRFADQPAGPSPLYLTAHLDHPAFVVERVISPTVVELAFRGGVMDDYFILARVECIDSDDHTWRGTLAERVDGAGPQFKYFLCELDRDCDSLKPGDIARWALPDPDTAEVDGVLCARTHACDDLAAAAAALGAYDELRRLRAAGQADSRANQPRGDVRLLFTRAEEVGFIGAIAACRHATLEPGARLLALENSRSFPDSPIGAGPIVRVGDRVAVFTPELTAAVAAVAEKVAGGPAQPIASQKNAELSKWRWQRKLMAGGACEASVFCAFGHASTCVCLPLGNYHNMADLAAVQAGTNQAKPTPGREYIAVADYHALIDLLLACCTELVDPAGAQASSFRARIDSLWNDLKFVLD